MAWWAEAKRRHWYCINGVNRIEEYNDWLYQQWWNSLSENQKRTLKSRIEGSGNRTKKRCRRYLRNL